MTYRIFQWSNIFWEYCTQRKIHFFGSERVAGQMKLAALFVQRIICEVHRAENLLKELVVPAITKITYQLVPYGFMLTVFEHLLIKMQ